MALSDSPVTPLPIGRALNSLVNELLSAGNEIDEDGIRRLHSFAGEVYADGYNEGRIAERELWNERWYRQVEASRAATEAGE